MPLDRKNQGQQEELLNKFEAFVKENNIDFSIAFGSPNGSQVMLADAIKPDYQGWNLIFILNEAKTQ